MGNLDPDIIRQLRSMALAGETPSRMLREVIAKRAPGSTHKLTLIQYFREAFCCSLQQAMPIGGWEPDETGELGDEQLDEYLTPEIQACRPQWEPLITYSRS